MADTTVETRLITEDELMALGSDAQVEIIDGEVVEMSPVGGLHHFIAGNLLRILDGYVQTHPIGFVFMDGLIYLLSTEARGLRGARVPDVSFIRNEHIPLDWNIQRPLPAAPTLAIEVMSPDDKPEDVLIKVREFLDAGSEQVWVAYPLSREVHQFIRGTGVVRTYRGDEMMDVSALFPDLSLSLSAIFKVPALKQ